MSELSDLFTINSAQFADGVSVFDQNLADLNDYGDGVDRNGARSNETWNLNHLYAGLPLKDEPPELHEDNRFDPLRPFSDVDGEVAALSTASTSNEFGSIRPNNQLYGMLRHQESPTLNLSQVIEWSDYFSNATKTEPHDANETATEPTTTTTEQNTTENFKNVRVKLESEGDDDDRNSSDDCKNSTSGFSSNVELTEEVTLFSNAFCVLCIINSYCFVNKNRSLENVRSRKQKPILQFTRCLFCDTSKQTR